MSNLDDITKTIFNEIEYFEDTIESAVKALGEDVFASKIEVSIQNIPLDTFTAITSGTDVNVKMYDVSEGIPCLESRYKIGTWGYVYLSSNPISEKGE